MTPTDAVRIAQGARSEARIETIDGRLCVTKRYNDYRGSPKVKLARELAFYRAYAAVPILPKLVAWCEPDTISVSHVAGERLIGVIESGARADAIRAVSANYGAVLQSLAGSTRARVPRRPGVAGRRAVRRASRTIDDSRADVAPHPPNRRLTPHAWTISYKT